MKTIAKITRISSKRLFQDLKSKSPIFCKKLNKWIKVWNLFFNHINWSSKTRWTKDIILRLLTIPLINEIINKWIFFP